MSSVDIITLIITLVCLACFCTVFTVLFRHYYLSNIEAINSGSEDIDIIDNAIDLERENKSKSKKTLRLIGKIVTYAILGLIFVFFIFSLVSKIRGNALPFGNSSIVVIATGSMSGSSEQNEYIEFEDVDGEKVPHLKGTDVSPADTQFDAYDIVGITKYASQSEIQLYDVVAYKSRDGVTIVHRIVEIQTDENGSITGYITQGDTNANDDSFSYYKNYSYLEFEDIIGHYNNFRIKGLGIIVLFLQSAAGIITVIAVIFCLLMYDHYSQKFQKALIDRTNMLVKLIDYDLNNPNVDSIDCSYHETLIYQGNTYTFKDGDYVSKTTDEGVEKKYENYMVFIKRVDGSNTVTVTDTRTGEEQVFENVTEEELKDPANFIKADEEEKE